MSAQLILQAIHDTPLLVESLPEASLFHRMGLEIPNDTTLSLDQKLGHIYEDAFALMLAASERYGLLEKGLQIQSDIHHTLGELDFLFRDHVEGRLIHLELAVKFYLAMETPDGLQLPGPDARDNYFQKLARLRTHQLTLARQYRKHLPEEYRKEEITPRHLILGCLFNHIEAAAPAEPEFLHPKARRGKWLRKSELQRYFANRNIEIIPKHLWPVPVSALDGLALSPLGKMKTLDRCVLLKIEGETMPVFLAPDSYPAG